jgi:hypothetical protein
MGTWQGDSNYDEVNDTGSINFNGCKPIGECGIVITVAEGWDDSTPRRHILLTCAGGSSGTEYSMDVDKAEALGLLIISAARGVREMAAQIDAEKPDDD